MILLRHPTGASVRFERDLRLQPDVVRQTGERWPILRVCLVLPYAVFRSIRRSLTPLLLPLAIALLSCVGTHAATAASRHASIAIDANTGEVLQASSADAPRYPASLTKMMTLYLVFEQMEAGKLNGKSRISISKKAESVAPSKLDLEPGSTIALDDAIKALVTKSANDVAVAIAEHIGGTESNFARLMTAKAHELGMKNTTFRNASGLPNDEQVTTARDMATLALRLMDNFPRHYRVFSTRSFSYNGKTYRNHNRLLFSYQGTDGIKTGYTRASGFNLVSSVHRKGRHVVAAVFGSKSSAARNVFMRALVERAMKRAKTEKTRRPLLVASAPAPKPAKRRQVAAASADALPWAQKPAAPAPAPAPARVAPAAEAVSTEPSSVRIDVAKVRRVIVPAPSQQNRQDRTADPRSALGGPDDRGTSAGPAPLAFASAGSTTDVIGGFIRGLPPSTLDRQAQSLSDSDFRTAQLARPPARGAAPRTRFANAAPRDDEGTGSRGSYQIQVGAYAEASEASRALASVAERAPDIVGGKNPLAIPVQKGERQFFRARFAGFASQEATKACLALRGKQIDCFVMKAE